MSAGLVKYVLCLLVVAVLLWSSAVSVLAGGTTETKALLAADLAPRPLPQKPATTSLSPGAEIDRVVLKFKDDLKVSLRSSGLYSNPSRSVTRASSLLGPYLDGRLRRLFGRFSEKKLGRDHISLQLKSRHQLADLNSYFTIEISDPVEAAQLINDLNRLEEIEIAYAEPSPLPANLSMDSA